MVLPSVMPRIIDGPDCSGGGCRMAVNSGDQYAASAVLSTQISERCCGEFAADNPARRAGTPLRTASSDHPALPKGQNHPMICEGSRRQQSRHSRARSREFPSKSASRTSTVVQHRERRDRSCSKRRPDQRNRMAHGFRCAFERKPVRIRRYERVFHAFTSRKVAALGKRTTGRQLRSERSRIISQVPMAPYVERAGQALPSVFA